MSPLRFLILSGPTREPIDPVRYLSNASSGRQGIALAEEALARGHEVDLVQGPVSRDPPPEANLHPVISARDMLERARELHLACDVLIAAAAISDYRPASPLERKKKREGGDRWTLELVVNPDILAELAPQKGQRIHIGFALETDDLERNALSKLRKKGLDWIVGNHPDAIDSEKSTYLLLGADGSHRELGLLTKRELARLIVRLAEEDQRPRQGAVPAP